MPQDQDVLNTALAMARPRDRLSVVDVSAYSIVRLNK